MVKVAGILSGVQRKVTKQGNPWAAATLEDLAGAIEVLFFPATYQLYATSIAEDAIVVVKGRIDRRDDVPKLIAMDVTVPDMTLGDGGPFVVSMPVTRCVAPVVEQLKEVLMTHPGPTEVHLRLRGAQRTTVVRLDDKLRVASSPGAAGRPEAAAGPGLRQLGAQVAPDIPQGADDHGPVRRREAGQRPRGELIHLPADGLLERAPAFGEPEPDEPPVGLVRLTAQQAGRLHAGSPPWSIVEVASLSPLAISPGVDPSSAHRRRRMNCWPSCTPCRENAAAEATASACLADQKAAWKSSGDGGPPGSLNSLDMAR